jgi:hypothetical protein
MTMEDRLAAAIEAREDGEPEQSAEMLHALNQEFPAEPEISLEYAATLRKLGRADDADAVLKTAIALHPTHYDLRRAWWQIPGIEVDYAGTLARGQTLRTAFPPHAFPASWESLAVELDCLYEMGDWERLEDAVARHWRDLTEQPEIFPHGVAALQKLFLNDELQRLLEMARPEAWARLSPEAWETLRGRVALARRNAEIARAAGATVISIGQNCLPYQVAGRWGFLGPRAEAADLTPFDLGGFTNNSAADAIKTGFAAFEDQGSFTVSKAWGGGKMYVHRPSQVGFFHERGSHWVTADGGKFFSRLALMVVNWQLRLRAKKRLYVFCYCGAGSVDRLVEVAAAHLLGPGAHLLVVNVLGATVSCPAHPQVTYLHAPYPSHYDWTSVFHQVSLNGFEFERSIADAMADCIGRLDDNVVAAPAITPATRLSRDDLISRVWSFGNRNGNLIAPLFGFAGDGSIEFYQNDNEARWEIADGTLNIFQAGGTLMWRARESFTDAAGRLHLILATPHNAALEFVLAETGHRERPSTQIRHYTARQRVLIIDGGLGIVRRLPKTLAGAEIVEIGHIAQVEDYPDFNMLCAGLLLSHIADAAEQAALIARLTARFSLTLFFEISGQNHDYLKSFGLESFHRGFTHNAGIDALDTDFVAAAARPSNVYKVEQFADEPAFDSFKPFVVSGTHQAGSMPSVESRGDYRVFDRPVFEISAYACHRFESLDSPLDQDLTRLEVRSLKFRAQSAGVGLEIVKRPEELGEVLYQTARDLDPAFNDRFVPTPATLWDEQVYATAGHDAQIADWREKFAHERVEAGVFALQNCIVSGVGAVFSNGVFVWGTDYLLIYLCSSRLDPIFQGMQRRHPVRHITGTAILGFNGLYDNYYHLVGEAMTSISLSLDVLRLGPDEKLSIITGKLNPVRRRYLEILLQDYPPVDIVELDRNEFITADTLIYCDNLGPSKPQNILFERLAFIDKMIRNCGLENLRQERLIYLARTDSAGRQVVNEPALIERMQAMGFEIYVATGQDVASQIATFRAAKMVVAPHGAGLTNVMFAQPGTIVLELVQAGYLNTGMMRLAQTIQARYYSEMFFEEGEAVQSWVVDIDRVCGVVERLLTDA